MSSHKFKKLSTWHKFAHIALSLALQKHDPMVGQKILGTDCDDAWGTLTAGEQKILAYRFGAISGGITPYKQIAKSYRTKKKKIKAVTLQSIHSLCRAIALNYKRNDIVVTVDDIEQPFQDEPVEATPVEEPANALGANQITPEPVDPRKLPRTRLDRLNLPPQVRVVLLNCGFTTVLPLRRKTDAELLAIPGFGEGTLKAVRTAIKEFDAEQSR